MNGFDFEAIFDSINTGLINRDADLNIIKMNKAAQRILGYDQKTFKQKPLQELIDKVCDEWEVPLKKEDYPPVQALKTARIVQDKVLVYMKDNHRKWLNITSIPHTSENGGTIDGVLSIFVDITARKQAELKLQESEKFNLMVMDNIPQHIFWKDRDLNYLGCNKNFASAAGLNSPEEIVGKSDFDLAWQEDESLAFRQDDRKVMDAGKAMYHIIETQLQADGTQAWLDTNKIPLRDSRGNVLGILGTFEVITDRIQAEEELKSLKNYLTNIIDSMPSALIGVDNNFAVNLWNTGASRLTGVEKKYALTHKIEEIIPWFSDQRKLIEQVFSTGEHISQKKQNIALGGKIFYEDITFFPIKKMDAVDSVILRIDDVTEQVRLQEQLLQSQKMDALGQLTGGMAHDFNNILTGIFGAADLLRLRMDPEGQNMKLLEMIETSAERASELIAKLLIFSRTGSSSTTIVDLHSILKDSISILNNTLDKRIQLEIDLKARHCHVRGNASELQTIFLNLGINASHAMPEGGKLSFSTTIAALDDAYCRASGFNLKPGEFILVRVEDSGTGIPQDLIDKIFNPFFTTKDQGTGLGLSTVYGLIKQVDGAVSVYSEPDKGTSFVIYLPLQEEVASFRNRRRESSVKGSGTVLIIDDEKLIRNTTKSILEDLGYDTILACDGNDGVRTFMEHRDEIDLVLMDMIMPKKNGVECFRELRAVKKNIPIILSSGFSYEEDINKLEKEGLSGFIQKPYNTRTLSKIVREAICRNK